MFSVPAPSFGDEMGMIGMEEILEVLLSKHSCPPEHSLRICGAARVEVVRDVLPKLVIHSCIYSHHTDIRPPEWLRV